METKFLISVVFTFVVQASLALPGTPLCSCEATTGLEADLATIQFGEDSTQRALHRAAYLVFNHILAVDREIIGKSNEDPADDAETFTDELLTALTVAIRPGLDADRTIQPNLDVEAIAELANPILNTIVQGINDAILAAQNLTYFESLAEIDRNERAVVLGVRGIIGNVYNFSAININFTAEEQDLIEFVTAEYTTTIVDGFRTFFVAIRTLLLQRYFKTSAGDAYLIIRAEQEKAYLLFKVGIGKQYVLLRNIYLSGFFVETGILCGLFAVQSVHTVPVVKLLGITDISTQYV